MRDICTESVVKIVPKTGDKLLKYALMGMLAASLVLSLFVGLTGLAVTAILAFALYRHLPKTDGEYEYIHTNDIFDVDLVVGNRSRKPLCSVCLDQVLLVAPADSDEVSAFGHIQETDYAGNAGDENLYAMVYTKDGKQRKLLLQMNEQMRKSIRQWIPGKVRN